MWYSELPRVQRTIKYSTVPDVKGKGKTIEQFYQSRHCLVCDAIAQADLCGECAGAPQQSILMLNNQLRETESKAVEYERVCATCTQHGFDGATTCISIECPVYYERTKAQRKLGWVEKVRRAIAEF